ncbi:MAG: GFA family protein [Thiohalomonadales bacterium]
MRFEITGEIGNIIYCHCSKCRKAQGSAFATNGNLDKNEFNIVSGRNDLTGYESNPGQIKYFCKHCGSPILSKNKSKPESIRVRLGTIESDISEKKSFFGRAPGK